MIKTKAPDSISLRQIIIVIAVLLYAGSAMAAPRVQPFISAFTGPGELASMVATTKKKLSKAGFTVAGSYQPYENVEIIAFTNQELEKIALRSKRGGYGAAMRASVTAKGSTVELAYTNPEYWANAYRLADNLSTVKETLKATLGFINEFGSGDKKLTASDMRKYHYTFLMEYFDDPSELNTFDTHANAVLALENNLAAGKGSTAKVYRLDLGKDSGGKQMTLFGVALKGVDADDCSGDEYIMSRIDKSTPAHSAHLPYEILVHGNAVEALYARFRIALSWPHLPMMASETGATFMSIMCAPGAIEEALEQLAGIKEEEEEEY